MSHSVLVSCCDAVIALLRLQRLTKPSDAQLFSHCHCHMDRRSAVTLHASAAASMIDAIVRQYVSYSTASVSQCTSSLNNLLRSARAIRFG